MGNKMDKVWLILLVLTLPKAWGDFQDIYNEWIEDLRPGYIVQTYTTDEGQRCHCKVPEEFTSTTFESEVTTLGPTYTMTSGAYSTATTTQITHDFQSSTTPTPTTTTPEPTTTTPEPTTTTPEPTTTTPEPTTTTPEPTTTSTIALTTPEPTTTTPEPTTTTPEPTTTTPEPTTTTPEPTTTTPEPTTTTPEPTTTTPEPTTTTPEPTTTTPEPTTTTPEPTTTTPEPTTTTPEPTTTTPEPTTTTPEPTTTTPEPTTTTMAITTTDPPASDTCGECDETVTLTPFVGYEWFSPGFEDGAYPDDCDCTLTFTFAANWGTLEATVKGGTEIHHSAANGCQYDGFSCTFEHTNGSKGKFTWFEICEVIRSDFPYNEVVAYETAIIVCKFKTDPGDTPPHVKKGVHFTMLPKRYL